MPNFHYYFCIIRIVNIFFTALPHKFIKQPSDIDVTEKQPAVIPCYIESYPAAVIRWEKDSSPLPQDKR